MMAGSAPNRLRHMPSLRIATRGGAFDILAGRERATDRGANAEQLEQVRAHAGLRESFGRSVPGEVDRALVRGSEGRE